MGICSPKAHIGIAWVLAVVALAVLYIAALIPAIVDKALKQGIENGALITPTVMEKDSSSWRTWMDTRDPDSTPTMLSVYMLNTTNVDDVLAGAAPALNEVGPYVYRKHSVKYNPVFGTHPTTGLKTVTFREWTYFVFDREQTPAELNEDDAFTVPNTVFQIWRTVADTPIIDGIFAAVWNETNKFGDVMTDPLRMFTTRSVAELLWGYVDPRFDLPTSNEYFTAIADASRERTYDDADEVVSSANELLSRAGLNAGGFFPGYLGPNITEEQILDADDMWYTFYTGEDAPAMAYQWAAYTNATHIEKTANKAIVPIWGNLEASRIHGTDGTRFAPFEFVDKDAILSVYLSNARRSVPLRCDREEKVHGVDTFVFRLSPEVLQNVTLNPDNEVYFQTGPSGMFTLKPFNVAPMALTKPHFLDASDVVLTRVTGLNPERSKHETELYVEPHSGVTFRAEKRLQMAINTIGPLTVKGLPKKPIWFADMAQDTWLPPVWFQEAGQIRKKDAIDFSDAMDTAATIKKYALPAGLAFGTVFALAAATMFTMSYVRKVGYGHPMGAFPPAINSNDYSEFQ